MLHAFKLLFSVSVLVGAASMVPTAQAESAKPGKAEASATKKNQAGVNEFEENRRAHMQKSKENNAKKGAE